MPRAVRKWDINNAGGRDIGRCAPTVLINNRPAGVIWDTVSPHPPHLRAYVAEGSETVFSEYKNQVYIGCLDSCGHYRMTGSPDVIVGP